jgi:hypothetical protein
MFRITSSLSIITPKTEEANSSETLTRCFAPQVSILHNLYNLCCAEYRRNRVLGFILNGVMFWFLQPCTLSRGERFGGIYRLHLQSKSNKKAACVPLESLSVSLGCKGMDGSCARTSQRDNEPSSHVERGAVLYWPASSSAARLSSIAAATPFIQVKVKVTLRPTISRPVRHGVRRPSGTRDQAFFLLEIFF